MTPRRLLVISPHYPPDRSAGAHRARVLAPHLAAAGWVPTVLTVDPASYEGALDPELADLVPHDVRVVRVPAWRAAATRRAGLGDLGLRAFLPLYRAARRLPADAIYLTTYPLYPAAFGPRLARALGVPLVVDLQDPWVGEWGRSVGGGPDAAPDWKSRASRALAVRIERAVLPQADALTSVSSALLDELVARYPVLAARPRLTLPIGIDPREIAWLGSHPREIRAAPPPDGALHLSYVGTLLPLGRETLQALLMAMARLNDGASPAVHLHLVGTSNQADATHAPLARAAAEAEGVSALVHEEAGRVPYLDAMRVLAASAAVVVLGTRERRYTASKLQPALASGRPVLAIVHAESDVARVLAPLAGRDPAIALITYTDDEGVRSRVPQLAATLALWRDGLPTRRADTRFAPGATGPELAVALGRVLDEVTRARR